MEISSERIDDIPVVVEWLKKMEIAKWIDQKLKPPHGNHQGLSYGELSVLMLVYIITQSDHRLCAIEEWVKSHKQILELTTGWKIGDKDTSDDRLARVVEELGKQEVACTQIEQKLGQHLIRTYELPTVVARTDTTSFNVNHQQIESESESLLRYGHSKDQRPDLLQYRQLLGTLDPAGIPLISSTLPGNGADDPEYWPAWQKMAQVIGHKKFVFLADVKAAAIATRGQIAANKGIYCFPLPMTGQNPLLLKQWVLDPPSSCVEIRLPKQEATESAVGKGFEVEIGKLWLNPETEKWIKWHERYLVIHSYNLACSQIQGLEKRLNSAQAALEKLATKPGNDLVELDNKVEAILKRHRVKEFFCVSTKQEIITQNRYVGRGRPSTKSSLQQVNTIKLNLQFSLESTAIEQAKTLAGWRLYVTNAPTSVLELPSAVIYYRDQWLLERGFHRFKRGNLPALPIYFQNQERIVGLMFLLTLALRVFTLIEYVVREALQNTNQSLPGLYHGNPQRRTERPSTEQLLKAFSHITFYRLPDLTTFITPLSPLQQQILSLMNLPESIYQVYSAHCQT